jgi:DDE family transposase
MAARAPAQPHRSRQAGLEVIVASERHGIPLDWAIDGAHRNDVRLLEPTLDTIDQAGLLADIGVLHLDLSYDSPALRDRLRVAGIDQFEIQRRGTKVPGVKRQPLRLGLRWVVEATNTWWSNYGQLRRNTDRRPRHRHAALCLAIAILIVGRSSTGASDGAPDKRCFAFSGGSAEWGPA